MAFTAADVMKSAANTLQDEDLVRWPAQDLRDYINDGLREIAARKPNACTETLTLSLPSGTRHALPAEYTVLSRVICNRIASSKESITVIESMDLMDATITNWQDPAVLPFHAVVKHVINDLADPRTFYVVPGNNGMGMIEVVVGKIPDLIPLPATNPEMLNSYAAFGVDLPDVYKNSLTNYVLMRAFAKDSGTAGAAQRAVAHSELFQAGLAGFAASEVALSASAAAKQGG